LNALQPYVRKFNSAEAREKDDLDFVVDYFGHQRQDVEEWLKTVKWEEHLAEVDEKVIKQTLR
jgi:O-methyltransferase involved in polyketide biosynthesis